MPRPHSHSDDEADDEDTKAKIEENYGVFQDCLSTAIIERLAPTSARAGRKPGKRTSKGRKGEVARPTESKSSEDDGNDNDAAELGDFTEYLAGEIFPNLPAELRTLSYAATRDDEALAAKYASPPLDKPIVAALVAPLPLSIADSLASYRLIDTTTSSDHDALSNFLTPILASYTTSTTAAPPTYTPSDSATRRPHCEICLRDHLPLTYHHLIPRQMHAKAIKRGWHRDWEVAKVAWLCRACHSFVHAIATNEELARELHSVELLMEREDVQKWAKWVGKVRWKKK